VSIHRVRRPIRPTVLANFWNAIFGNFKNTHPKNFQAAIHRAAQTISSSTTATSVVAISRVRREKRQLSHGMAAKAARSSAGHHIGDELAVSRLSNAKSKVVGPSVRRLYVGSIQVVVDPQLEVATHILSAVGSILIRPAPNIIRIPRGASYCKNNFSVFDWLRAHNTISNRQRMPHTAENTIRSRQSMRGRSILHSKERNVSSANCLNQAKQVPNYARSVDPWASHDLNGFIFLKDNLPTSVGIRRALRPTFAHPPVRVRGRYKRRPQEADDFASTHSDADGTKPVVRIGVSPDGGIMEK
jgi:hypothetical protein